MKKLSKSLLVAVLLLIPFGLTSCDSILSRLVEIEENSKPSPTPPQETPFSGLYKDTEDNNCFKFFNDGTVKYSLNFLAGEEGSSVYVSITNFIGYDEDYNGVEIVDTYTKKDNKIIIDRKATKEAYDKYLSESRYDGPDTIECTLKNNTISFTVEDTDFAWSLYDGKEEFDFAFNSLSQSTFYEWEPGDDFGFKDGRTITIDEEKRTITFENKTYTLAVGMPGSYLADLIDEDGKFAGTFNVGFGYPDSGDVYWNHIYITLVGQKAIGFSCRSYPDWLDE